MYFGKGGGSGWFGIEWTGFVRWSDWNLTTGSHDRVFGRDVRDAKGMVGYAG